MDSDIAPKSKRPSARRKVGRHEIRRVLHQRIINGDCRPGTKLVQQQLAKDFGVSMGMVREALLELQAWGLVETHDNRGIFVRQWNAERLLEAYDVREVLEGLATRLCCGRVNAKQMQRLRDMAHQIFRAAMAEKWDENARLDREFHHLIIELSGSQLVSRLAGNYRFLGKFVWLRGEPGNTLDTHLQIVRAIEENRPQDADNAARDHVARGRQSIVKQIADKTFDPHWFE